MDPKPLKTPEITSVQIVAAVGSIVSLFLTQHYIDERLAQLLTGVASIVIPIVWIAADAVIRHGRSRAFIAPPKGVVADDGPTPAPVVKAKKK